MTIAEAFDYIQKGGVVGLMFLIIIGGLRGWYVWGWLYRQIVRDRDEWKELALQGTTLVRKTTRHIERRKLTDEPEI